MKFNINNEVRVKLTDAGRAAHYQNHIEFWANTGIPAPEYTPPKEDDDGWSTWQMWYLMNEFGRHCYNGCSIPFDTTIEIPD